MPNKNNGFWLPYLALVGLVLIRFVPLLTGAKYLWGVSHLTLLPGGFVVGYAVLGAIALVIPWLAQAEKWGEKTCQWFEQTFFEAKSKYFARGVLVAIAGAMFALFAMPTHFLGDGYSYISNLGSQSGHWIKWSEGGALLSVAMVRSLLGEPSEASALLAFQIVSVISGMLTLWLYFLIAGVIAEECWKRWLVVITLVFSSSVLLFFGYAESYPILWGPLWGFLYFALKYLKHGKGLAPAVILLLVSTALHLQTAMYFPAALFLVLCRGRGRAIYDRFKGLVWTGIALVTAGVLVYAYLKYTGSIAVQEIFLLPFTGKPRCPDYAMFSSRHLADIVNLFLLVYPTGLVVAGLAYFGWRKAIHTSTARFLGLLSVGSLLFLVMIDPGLSMPRDWDLFSSCWIAPMLLILGLLPNVTLGPVKRLGVSFLLSAALFLAPFLLVNLNEQRGVDEIKQIIENNHDKSMGSKLILGTYYQKKGDREKAEQNLAEARASYPDFYKTKDAFEMLAAGRAEDAYRLFSQTKPDKYSKDYHSFLAGYDVMTGKAEEGLKEAKLAVELQPYFDRNYSTLAYAYLMNGDRPSALAALRRGYSLNSRNKEFLTGLALMTNGDGYPDSAMYYAEQLHVLDSTDAFYHFIRAEALLKLNQREQAKTEALQYIRLGTGGTGYPQNCTELRGLMPEIDKP